MEKQQLASAVQNRMMAEKLHQNFQLLNLCSPGLKKSLNTMEYNSGAKKNHRYKKTGPLK